MLGVGCRKGSPQISQVSLTSDEAGCYHNNFLLAVVTDAGKRFGLTVTQYDFSEPQNGKDVCDRILCPMKSAIRRYCCEGNDVLPSKDMRTALSERPVRGTFEAHRGRIRRGGRARKEWGTGERICPTQS